MEASGARSGSTSSTAAPASPVDAPRRSADAARRAPAAVRCGPGRAACVNAFGAGVADDKLAHAYVEDMVRFYLGEEPLLRVGADLTTSDPASAASAALEPARRAGDQAARRLRRQRRGGLRARDRRRARGAPRRSCAAHPRGASRRRRSRCPATRPSSTAASPRHVDLRPFVIIGRGDEPRCAAVSRAWRSTRARWSSTARRTAAPRTRGCCR